MQHDNNVQNILKKLINHNSVLGTHLNVESLESSEYKQTGVVTKNSTEIFLEILGLNEPNILPVPVGSNDCRVPY